jgi:hypothetical protein
MPKKRFTLPKSNLVQPILTVVLIGLLIVLVVYRKVSFDEASKKFETGSYEIYTRGSLLVKKIPTATQVDPSQKQSTTEKTVEFEENPYNNLFFYTNSGQVKRLDVKTNGEDVTYFHTPKNEVVIMNVPTKTYTVYPVPDDSEKKAIEVFNGINNVIQSTFPLIPLLKEYREGKFNPVEKSQNLYTGQWQHPLFTSGEVLDVFIETDTDTGLFKSFNVTQNVQAPASRIFFDFKVLENPTNIYNIPTGYTEVPVKTPYKPKS